MRAVIENLRTEIPFAARRQDINDIFTLKSITVSSFSNCQKYEDITARWRDEDIKMSSFSLYYTWRNHLYLDNCMILEIIMIMFIYSEIVVIWDPWVLYCHTPQMTLPGCKSKSADWKRLLANNDLKTDKNYNLF